MLDAIDKKPKRSRAQKILDDIETNLRSLIKEKKALWKGFAENQRVFKVQWEEAKKLENKLILFWDYWSREVEMAELEKQIQVGMLPDEREELMKEISTLNKYNKILLEGIKQGEIDAQIVTKVKKRLGIWENEKEETK